jgi:hypothetical protein
VVRLQGEKIMRIHPAALHEPAAKKGMLIGAATLALGAFFARRKYGKKHVHAKPAAVEAKKVAHPLPRESTTMQQVLDLARLAVPLIVALQPAQKWCRSHRNQNRKRPNTSRRRKNMWRSRPRR